MDEATKRVTAQEAGRLAFHVKYFKVDANDPSLYDLTLNMEGTTVDQAAQTIVAHSANLAVT